MKTRVNQFIHRPFRAIDVLHIYLWIVMLGLFLQGIGSLALRLIPGLPSITPVLVMSLMLAHIPHAILHIVWGLAGILFLLIFHSRRALIGLGLVFGAFYTLLGISGVLVNNAFGLQLALGENAFHLIVGPLTLIVTFVALFSRNATFQKELRNQASSG
jgi:hypothetical protein